MESLCQYLEQVFASLRRAGIVKSIKGPQGGYLLNRDPKDIAVAEILEALDGTYRLEDQEMQEKSSCPEITDTIQNPVDQSGQCSVGSGFAEPDFGRSGEGLSGTSGLWSEYVLHLMTTYI